MIVFDRDVFFDAVRNNPFSGSLSQDQVDGMNAILQVWQDRYPDKDLRWLAYALATTMHETGTEMMPIEEYGKGEGMEYGKKDPETGQTYYGRGYVQTTWRDNYARADKELGLGCTKNDPTSCEWHAENQLNPDIAAQTMFEGMIEGWFRSDSKGKHTLARYFDVDTNDAYNAREIINGDKSKVPSWSNGVSIGNLIKGYHQDFLAALEASVEEVEDEDISPLPTDPTDPTEGGVWDVYMLRVTAGATVELMRTEVKLQLTKPSRRG